MKQLKITLSLVLTLFSTLSFGQEVFSFAPTIYPYAFYQTGSYEYASGIDEGSINGAGIGAKFGMNVPFLLIGGDVTYLKPILHSDSNNRGVNENKHPLVDEELVSYGPTISLRLGRLTLNYTYFMKQEMTGTIKNQFVNQSDGKYSYEGTGQKMGVALAIIKGLTLDVSVVSSSFDKYTLSKDINGEVEADSANRDPLEMQSTMFSIAYNISFKDFKNLF